MSHIKTLRKYLLTTALAAVPIAGVSVTNVAYAEKVSRSSETAKLPAKESVKRTPAPAKQPAAAPKQPYRGNSRAAGSTVKLQATPKNTPPTNATPKYNPPKYSSSASSSSQGGKNNQHQLGNTVKLDHKNHREQVKRLTAQATNKHYRRRGHHINHLPRGFSRLYHHAYPLYFYGGTYYRPYRDGYHVVRAPFGVRIRHLPVGYVSFSIGSSIFFYVNDTYYRRDGNYYVVTEYPHDYGQDYANHYPETVPVASTYSTGDWVAYPTLGQSPEQLELDRYQCHRWAKEQTGFDPTLPNQDQYRASDYYRAQAACMEGRGYTVR